MDELNRYIVNCNMADNQNVNIVQFGITFKNKFFYETRSNSNVYIFEYVTSGKGYVILDDKLYTLSKNNFYIIPTGRTYEYFADSETPYERYWFYGTGKLFENLYKTFFGDAPIAVCKYDFLSIYQKLFNTLSKIKEDKEDYFALNNVIFEIFNTAQSHYISPQPIATSISKSTASRIKSYLISHYKEKFDLQQLQKTFGLSKNQIIRIFKNAYNQTPQVFHTMYKLDIAEEMLRRGMTNKEIADELDFYDDRYFSKTFIKYKGYTPKSVKQPIKNRH